MTEVRKPEIWYNKLPYQSDSEVKESSEETSEESLNNIQVNSKNQVRITGRLVNESFRSDIETLVTDNNEHRVKTREEKRKIRNARQRKRYRERKRHQLKKLQRENELLREILEERKKVSCDQRCCHTNNRITKMYKFVSSMFNNLVNACKCNN